MADKWNIWTKPPARICPQGFCFHWADLGDKIAKQGRLYSSVDDALAEAVPVMDAGCTCSFGLCIRADAIKGDSDWYEPNEPALAKASLPWFYFIPSVKKVADELREDYMRESTRIWGQHDGLK
jgi:hypothetical protein